MKAGSTALCSAVAAPVLAQGGWVTPQPPCEISAAHFKVNGGVLHLKAAAEKPDQRTGQLAEARRVLVEAILQDKQDKNPGAWYYLGRYYFETGDAAGADSALARDRKSTRLNSSHSQISYAVFCLKKKNAITDSQT